MKFHLRLAAVALGLAATAAVAAPPSGHPSPAQAMQMMQKEPVELTRTGKVLSHIDSNEYTYVEVSEKGNTLWLAAPRTELKDGDTVRFPDGVVMRDFYSKLLQRTFPAVMFVESVEPAKGR
ncbi:MAG TPA: hypothetical protein VJ576_21645 [Rhodocyclaceae bacterium]|nr:hypothetical protein [Rhodocyclaceae bacterium]